MDHEQTIGSEFQSAGPETPKCLWPYLDKGQMHFSGRGIPIYGSALKTSRFLLCLLEGYLPSVPLRNYSLTYLPSMLICKLLDSVFAVIFGSH